MPYQIDDELNKGLSYDLRQIYAIVILGSHLKRIDIYKEQRNFSKWFDALEDLSGDIDYKLNEKERTEIKRLTDIILNLSVAHPDIFSGANKQNPQVSYEIYKAMTNLNKILIAYMDTHEMFGAGREEEGL